MQGRVLIIAGSDSGGGAGIQGDIKTVTCMNGYAMTALTALTAQNSVTVSGIYEISAEFVLLQIKTILEDFGADCIKIGMLYNDVVAKAVTSGLKESAQGIPIVLDPVITSKSGTRLLEQSAIKVIKEILMPITDLITPNIPEAEILTGVHITREADMAKAGRILLDKGAKAVLVKGAHFKSEDNITITDVLVTSDRTQSLRSRRMHSKHTHGTGCSLSSAIATSIAQGISLRQSVLRARSYVARAIRRAPGLGHGYGPIDHAHTVRNDWE